MGVGFTTKHPPWEGYGQFLKQHIKTDKASSVYKELPKDS